MFPRTTSLLGEPALILESRAEASRSQVFWPLDVACAIARQWLPQISFQKCPEV